MLNRLNPGKIFLELKQEPCGDNDQNRKRGESAEPVVNPAIENMRPHALFYEENGIPYVATMLTALNPRHIRLFTGPFAHARDRNADWLLALDPLRLLHGFYQNAGLPTRGDAYGGWEQQSLAGHSLGHYLSACIRLAAASERCDTRFVERVALILTELERCQNARTDGFIGGMPDADRVFSELRAGEVRARNFDLNDCWVPWYNLHKLFAGLLDAILLLDDTHARALVTKLGDWAIEVTATLDEAQWQTMLACEFGGMNESFAELYALTGDPRYLAMAERFYHRAVLDPLAEGTDCLPGLHGNTQIPKILGCARLYEVTGDEKYRRICENFWRFVVDDHSYVIGGHGSHEHFGPAGNLAGRLTHATCETCNSYNLLKLAEHLFCWEPKAAYADFAERVRINHILASQNPETGMVCYFVSLLSGHFKHYSTLDDSFWCCVGTGWENHTRYSDGVIFEAAAEQTLYVNQFLSCSCVAPDQLIGLTLSTDFPLSPRVMITVATHELAVPFTLKIRKPDWVSLPMELAVNGERVVAVEEAGYLRLQRTWHEGDRIEVFLPFSARYEPLLGAPTTLALLDGPVVLAADLGEAPEPGDADGGEPFGAQIPPAPVLLDVSARSFERPVTLAPFWQLHGKRQAVYFDCFSPEQWAQEESAYRAKEAQEHRERMRHLDTFWPNQMQPERDHHFQSTRTRGGERSAWKFREVTAPEGWFSFSLRNLPTEPVELVCTWGPPQDTDVAFVLEAEGHELARPTFTVERHRHLHLTYALPWEWTQGKERVTIRVVGRSAPLFLAKLQRQLN